MELNTKEESGRDNIADDLQQEQKTQIEPVELEGQGKPDKAQDMMYTLSILIVLFSVLLIFYLCMLISFLLEVQV